MAQTDARFSAIPQDYGVKDRLNGNEPMTPDTAVPPTPTSTWPAESLAEISDSDDEVIFQGSSGAPPRSHREEILADFEAQLSHLPANLREIAVGRLRARMEESDTKARPEVQIVDTPPKGPNPRKLQVEDVVPVATPLRSQKAKLNDSKSDPDAFVSTPVMKTRFSTPGRPLAETSLSRMFFSAPSGSTAAPAPQVSPVQATAMAMTPPVEQKEKVNMVTPPVSEAPIDGSVGATTPVTPVSLPKISSAIFGQRETVECFPRSLIRRRPIVHRQVAAIKAKAKASMKVIRKAQVKANKARKRRTTKAKVKQRTAKAKAKAKISAKVPRKAEVKKAKEVARVKVPQAAPNLEATPVDVVNNKAGGNAPMRMILAGEDALKTTSLKLPEIPALRIASTPQAATALSDAGKESDDDMPLCALAELAPLTKLKRSPKTWAEQLRYPLESTQFPVRIYPTSQESEEDLDDPWSSCSEPEEDDLLDREGRSVTELVWCRTK